VAKKRKPRTSSAGKKAKARRSRGRPVLFEDPRLRARFLKHLLETGSKGRAVTLCKVSYTTFNCYVQRDPEFAAAVDATEQQALDELEEVAHKGALKDPMLALRILERKRHKTWGKKTQVTHEGKVLHGHVELGELRREILDDPEYLEYLRTRSLTSSIDANGDASSVRADGQQGEVEAGSAPRLG